MKLLISVGLSAIYGLFVRLIFGFLDNFMGVMSLAFLALAPLVIGFLTIIFLPRNKVTSNTSAFFTPWLSCFIVLMITLLFNVEGVICWIMIFPFFAILAGIGGIIAHRIKKKKAFEEQEEYQDFLKDLNKPQVSLILLIPLFVGVVEGDRSLSRQDYYIKEKVIVEASKEDIWKNITAIGSIEKKEAGSGISDFIGFPRHIKTTTSSLAVHGTRKAIYEKGLFFDEVIEEIVPFKKLRLKVITQPDKVPPTVMDEHILIGGKYVDILEDQYEVKEVGHNKYEVSLSSHFFINTPFNWYAGIWSKFLMRDVLSKELARIKSRAQLD